MCSPISNEEFPLPVDQMIERLETQMIYQEKFSNNPPSWKKASWKKFSEKQRNSFASSVAAGDKSSIPGSPNPLLQNQNDDDDDGD